MVVIDDLVQQVGIIRTITKIVLRVESRFGKGRHCVRYQNVNSHTPSNDRGRFIVGQRELDLDQ